MAKQFILGAGLIGAELTRQLLTSGDEVTVGTRRGTVLPGAAATALDASDADAVRTAAIGAETIFVCTNPPYPNWAEEWPPIGESVMVAARETGARLVLMGNLYAHGIPDGPMTASTPFRPADRKGRIRAELSDAIFAAHRRGEVQATEIRASDYFGPGAGGGTAHLGTEFFAPLLAGKTAWVVGNPRLRHSWAFLPDIAATLVAAARTESAFGRAWITPHSTDLDRKSIAGLLARRTGTTGRVVGIPSWALRGIGAFSAQLREVAASSYQFTHEFIADSSETEELLGLRATPLDAALEVTLASLKQ